MGIDNNIDLTETRKGVKIAHVGLLNESLDGTDVHL